MKKDKEPWANRAPHPLFLASVGMGGTVAGAKTYIDEMRKADKLSRVGKAIGALGTASGLALLAAAAASALKKKDEKII